MARRDRGLLSFLVVFGPRLFAAIGAMAWRECLSVLMRRLVVFGPRLFAAIGAMAWREWVAFGPRLFAAIGAMAWRECFDEAFGSFRSQAVRSHRGHGVESEFC